MMKTLIRLFVSVTWLSGVVSSNQLVQSDPAVIKPGNSHTLTCQGSGGFTFGGNNMHWIRQFPDGKLQWLCRIYNAGSTNYHDEVKGRFTATRDDNNNKLTLKMDNMKTEDTSMYYCARRDWAGKHYFDTWGPGTFVTVTSAVKSAPSVFPLVPCLDAVASSSHILIGCLSTGYLPTPVDVTWNSGSITSGIKNLPAVLTRSGNYMSSHLLTISDSDWKSNKYTCNVEHKATGVKINKDIEFVDNTPLNPPTVELAQASCGESGSVDLVCLISGYSPNDIKISWLLNGKATSISPTNSTPYKDNDGNFGTRSQVSVPRDDWSSGDTYTCRVSHPPSDTRNEDSIRKCPGSESSVSSPKIVILPPSPKDLLVTKEPKLTCEVSRLFSVESINIKWKRNDGKKIQAFTSEPVQQFDGSYTVASNLRLSIADWESEKPFTCVVEHSDLPAPVEKTIHKKDEPTSEPSVYMFPPPAEELALYDFVGITCLIKRFSPKNVYVQWKKNNIVMEEEKYSNTEPILDEDSDTYLMYSTAWISKSEWNRGATFTCSGLLSKITSKEIKKSRGK